MFEDRRKHVRRYVDYHCWLAAAGASPSVKGQVRNISKGGAKVVCPHSDVPDIVDLHMTQDGKVARRCKVVWRSEDAIGLMFVAKAEAPGDQVVVV